MNLPGIDARWYQLTVLSALLAYGITVLGFDCTISQAVLTLATVSLVQIGASRFYRLPRVELKSALISGLSLCLLLRTNDAWIIIFTGVVTILSKFLIRMHGRHVFNPTNFGLVVAILVTGRAWVSPGQWGSYTLLALLFVCLGGMVVNRALRSDVALAFLVAYPALLLWRATWLGDPLSIPLHQVSSGAFLLFTFFMISDPRTTPETRLGRVLFAVIVAAIAYHFRFRRFDPNALLYALVLGTFAVPIIDLALRGRRFEWGDTVRRAQTGKASVL